MSHDTHDDTPSAGRLERFVPLTGAAFALLAIGGDLTIGPFPDSSTPIPTLTRYYAAHHGRVYAGGLLLSLSAIFLAFFGAALWTRIRRAGGAPWVAGAVLVGAAVSVAAQLSSASSFMTLGDLGSGQPVSGAALQSWHIGASTGSTASDVVLLLAVAAAGILARAFPRWLAWPALVLVIGYLSPLGFVTSLAFLLWTLVAGVALTVRPVGPAHATSPGRARALRADAAVSP